MLYWFLQFDSQTIQVGSDYQAPIPDGLHKYGDAPGKKKKHLCNADWFVNLKTISEQHIQGLMVPFACIN